MNSTRIRQIGSGAPYIEERYPRIHKTFLAIMAQHTAGCPMNETIKWTYLTHEEIVEKLAEQGIHVSVFMVRILLKIHNFKKRKMRKSKTIKSVKCRDQQFQNIHQKIEYFNHLRQPVTSIDTKKKEPLGNLYRPGNVYCSRALEVYDHDFGSLQTGQIVPHGIYDLFRNEALINLGTSKDTAAFVHDSLLNWWQTYGQIHYPKAHSWLILCDGGGSNNCRHYVFKEAIQKLANTTGIIIHIAHYPAYCSKYNLIEHRVFPHVTKALDGIPLDTVQTVKELIENRAKTKTGLKVAAQIIDKVYLTGIKASQEFVENMPIIFDEILPKWNYKAVPIP